MKIKEPIVSEIAYQTYCINEFGMDAMFLLVGENKALLIDTGTGTFNVKELVSKLTDKPLVVALTHGHVDHFGGAGCFDEVYLHEADFEMARSLTIEQRQDYARTMAGMSGDLFAANQDSVIDFNHMPSLISLREGDSFDLGGRVVKVYETPGHTAGSVSFLDEKEKIMITGDACNINTLLMGGSLETLLETAKKLKSLECYYNRNYNGHIGYASNVHCLPQAYSVNKDAIECLEGLLDGTLQGIYEKAPFMNLAFAYHHKNFGVRYQDLKAR